MHVRSPTSKFQLEPGSSTDVIFLAADGRDIPWAENFNWGLRDLQTILGSEQLAQECALWAASEATCPWNFCRILFSEMAVSRNTVKSLVGHL